MGIKEGDIVTLVTPRRSYAGTPQGVNATVEEHIPVVDATLSEFLDAAVGNTYYRLVGTVGTLSETDQYGNFNISDGTSQVYVYGLVPGWRGASRPIPNSACRNGTEGKEIWITIVGRRAALQ